MRKRKTRKQKEKGQKRVKNEHKEKRLELDACEISDRIEKIHQKIRANRKINKILIILFIFLFIISLVSLIFQKSEIEDIEFMQLIENNNSNMGYYLAYISVIYTLFLEFQEWFIDKYREKKSDNKFKKLCVRLAKWLYDVPLFLLPIVIAVVLMLVKKFLMHTDYANIICVLTICVQTLFIHNKKKQELELQNKEYTEYKELLSKTT